VAASTTAAAGADSTALASAALVAGLGSGAVGLYDDVVGQRPEQKAAKGFKGHLAALRDRRVTSGLVKIAGIGISALVAASLVGRARRSDRPVTDLVIDTGLIAGSANLVNLLDLRPGRALKAGIAVSGSLGAGDGLLTGPSAAAAALLRDDLDERVMLGDAGANSFGALIGLAAASRHGRAARLAMLAGIVGLTLASEKVSFTQVIESTPVLRDLDGWGRRAR
jgi:UDP-N-acetylmuramyl pentapeptide phosphotransferase/UDP-N-acetylglucosamine-1-phosphate transferase